MDDFGTGYSSLGYLQRFPFDKIKIDQSFVRALSNRSESHAIIRAVAGLGLSLGISTTAEGVETEDQLKQLKAEGCTEVQGYLFSRPRPASELGPLLRPSLALRAACAPQEAPGKQSECLQGPFLPAPCYEPEDE
jgi:EAL domain-containing protein (putative c-di-GMP-specific phosphodiesterase class I)